MVNSQTFTKKNDDKYRAKVTFKRIYDTEDRMWKDFYCLEKDCNMTNFLQSIAGLITKELAGIINYMAYTLYEFYYVADNIKIRKHGDEIIMYYGKRK